MLKHLAPIWSPIGEITALPLESSEGRACRIWQIGTGDSKTRTAKSPNQTWVRTLIERYNVLEKTSSDEMNDNVQIKEEVKLKGKIKK